MTANLRETTMKGHAAAFELQPLHAQQKYEEAAETMGRDRMRQATEEIDNLEAALELQQTRMEQERLDSEPLSRLGCHKFTASDLQKLADMYNSSAYSLAGVDRAIAKMKQPPVAPREREIAHFEEFRHTVSREHVVKDWVKCALHNRDEMVGTAFSTAPADADAYLFFRSAHSASQIDDLGIRASLSRYTNRRRGIGLCRFA